MKLKNNFFPRVLFILSVICFVIAAYLIWQRYTPQTISFDSLPVVTQSPSSNWSPNGLAIPSLDISLTVENQPHKSIWPVSSTGIIHINDTNIYYGHNWPNLLGKLKKVQIGDEIKIHTISGENYIYRVIDIKSVWPNQPDILNQDPTQKIVLYTCTGFLDMQRLVVIASLIN